MLGQGGEQGGAVDDPPGGDLVDHPPGEQRTGIHTLGLAGAGRGGRLEHLVGRGLDQPRPGRVVGAGPALFVVPGVADVVEVGAPGRWGGVEGQTAGQLDPGDQHMHMHPVPGIRAAVLHGGPRVPVGGQAGEREGLEVGQHPRDLLRRGAVIGVERDHRRAVAVHRAQAVGHRRDLGGVTEQNLDVVTVNALVVPLAEQVGRGLRRRSGAVAQELDVHRSALPTSPGCSARPRGQPGPERGIYVGGDRLQGDQSGHGQGSAGGVEVSGDLVEVVADPRELDHHRRIHWRGHCSAQP